MKEEQLKVEDISLLVSLKDGILIKDGKIIPGKEELVYQWHPEFRRKHGNKGDATSRD